MPKLLKTRYRRFYDGRNSERLIIVTVTLIGFGFQGRSPYKALPLRQMG